MADDKGSIVAIEPGFNVSALEACASHKLLPGHSGHLDTTQ